MISGLNRSGFWRRRVRDPLVSLLRQGLDPGALALSLAAGLVLGLFPIIGATTVLCLAAGFAFRLSHVALQLANHLAYPLQLVLIPAFVRVGETLLGAPHVTLNPLALVRHFQRDAPGFLREFGLTGLHGILGWAVVAPPLFLALFLLLRPPLRRFDQALRGRGPMGRTSATAALPGPSPAPPSEARSTRAPRGS
jgi:uncharacterized protein (DUF2062 family)